MEKPNINDFNEEKSCEYKDRQYLVRDNGAILRLPKEGCRASKYDNVWSFGTKDEKTGYMILAGNIRVHQVVCTAFHGPEPEPHMVVDHIDTNRCNNRPENLRWLTRIENALNNPVTRKKIAYLCGGSIEPFLENPAILRGLALSSDVSWMKTVTKEQAAACKKHMERWAEEDSKQESTGKGIGDWVFDDDKPAKTNSNRPQYAGPYKSWAEHKAAVEEMSRQEYEKQYGLKDSLTPGALQLNWKVPSEFPLCPTQHSPTPLQDYLANLKTGEVFCHNDVYESIVFKADISDDGNTIAVITTSEHVKGGSGYVLCTITYQDGHFIHENQYSYFEEIGAEKYFALALGREWTGGDVFDDYC